ncbi:MAG: phosphate acyltransferase PlsX [Clostridiales bacterium]|nr:phosphate acyltransferase PlsX [Clostridiales bacterium]
MKLVLDAFGGDNCPNCVIDGIYLAEKGFDDIAFVVTGDKTVIDNYINEKKYTFKSLEIVDAPDVVTCHDVPTIAIRTKKESSLVKALEILKTDDEVKALISTGSTGAILTGGFLKIGRIKGVSRPALCPCLPTNNGGNVMLIDCGANADCKPVNLCHFAMMGSIYYKELFGVENPRVALVCNGTEDEKGNELIKQTFPLMKKLPINFVGNMEARDALSGDYDVLVCDGFTGNVLLKSTEGAVSMVMGELKSALYSSLKAKLGALLCKKALKGIKNKLDYNKYGGSPFIGCKKMIIKSHGSSKDITILAAIKQAYNIEKSKINEKIAQQIELLPELEVGEND